MHRCILCLNMRNFKHISATTMKAINLNFLQHKNCNFAKKIGMDLYPGQLGISCFPRPSVSPPLVSHLSLEPSFASRFAVSGLTPLKPPTAGDSAVRHPTCVSVRITSRCPGLKVGPPPRSSMGWEAAFILATIRSRSRDSPAPAALDRRRPLGGSSSLEEQR